jgi:ERCC4-type nuclease
MISVDDRVGSVELADTIRAMHIEVTVKRLAFGDFYWEGNGPKGACTIGVERKRLRDLLCCIQDSRFAAHQLPGMIDTYDHCYLIVEGKWSIDGRTLELIEVCKDGWRPVRLGPSHGFMYRELDNYLNSIAAMSSCRVKTSTCPAETVAQLIDLYHWWQKSWGDHKSLKVLRKEPPKFSFFNPSVCQLMASCLPGIGYERSGAVAAKFHTPVNMVLGTVAEWMEVAGVGQGIATKVVRALTEESKEK